MSCKRATQFNHSGAVDVYIYSSNSFIIFKALQQNRHLQSPPAALCPRTHASPRDLASPACSMSTHVFWSPPFSALCAAHSTRRWPPLRCNLQHEKKTSRRKDSRGQQQGAAVALCVRDALKFRPQCDKVPLNQTHHLLTFVRSRHPPACPPHRLHTRASSVNHSRLQPLSNGLETCRWTQASHCSMAAIRRLATTTPRH